MAAGVVQGQKTIEPAALAAELAALGPRQRGGPGYEGAQKQLLSTMAAVGLDELGRLESSTGDWAHLTGHLRGASGSRIDLSAHYDTVAATSGVVDNASGCAVALAAVADLGRTPRRHEVRLLLTDLEEEAARGSREWLLAIEERDRERILANVNLDMLADRPGGPGVIHIGRASGRFDGARLTPAWLVHAVLQAAAAVDFPIVVLDRHWSLFAQLALRVATPMRISDSHSYLAVEVPSLTLSDLSITSPRSGGESSTTAAEIVGARFETWVDLVSASVRRLDGLTGRPAAESEYLVWGNRVWVRRDLLWLGFSLWVLMVWRGLPGRWRQRTSDDRRRAGRIYLPGFVFRMVFLVAIFLTPTLTAVLLCPLALCALVAAEARLPVRRAVAAIGAAPTIAFALWLAVTVHRDLIGLDSAALLPAAVVLLTLATFCSWMLDPVR